MSLAVDDVGDVNDSDTPTTSVVVTTAAEEKNEDEYDQEERERASVFPARAVAGGRMLHACPMAVM